MFDHLLIDVRCFYLKFKSTVSTRFVFISKWERIIYDIICKFCIKFVGISVTLVITTITLTLGQSDPLNAPHDWGQRLSITHLTTKQIHARRVLFYYV